MLTLTQRVRYASGNFGKSLIWSVLEFFLLYYLTDFLGFEPAVAGVVVLLALIWDGMTDPVIGFLADRYVERGGTYTPFLKFAPPVLILAFVSIFLVPKTEMPIMVALAILTNLGFRTLFTLYDVPHNSLLAAITADSRERSTLSALRFLFSSLGSLLVAIAIYPVLSETSIDAQLSRVVTYICGIGFLALIVMWLTVGVVRPRERANAVRGQPMRVKGYLFSLLENSHARHVFAIASIVAVSIPLFSKLLFYYATYVLDNQSWGSPLLTALTLGQIAGLPLWVRVSHVLHKARAMQLALVLLVVTLSTLGVFQPNDLYLSMGLIAIAGCAIGGTYTLVWAMAPDVVESLEYSQGRRMEAGLFSLLTLSQKVSLGVGGALAGLSLDWVGYQANQPQTEATLNAIPWILCGLPCAGALAALWALRSFDLDHDAHTSLRRKLGR